MDEDVSTPQASLVEGDVDWEIEETAEKPEQKRKRIVWGKVWENLLRLGLGEITLRIGGALASMVLILLVVWVMGNFYLGGPLESAEDAVSAAPLATNTPVVAVPYFDIPNIEVFPAGVTRQVALHTLLPAKPRDSVVQYEVKAGDTIFGIAEKFNLRPETILWSNYYVLADNPHLLSPGQKLNILPVDGVYYEWHAGDGLNGVAEFYGVKPEDIINFPANNLNPEKLGDWSNPNIEPGTWLVIPGGRREFVTWSAPRITRQNPAVAKVLGPGFCGTVMDGPVGNGTFVWPTVERWLSGFDYSPETNHFGVDFAGREGNAVFAVDNGVVVYAGWNDWGYGNVVVIDHGNGWQSLYAHLSAYNVECGSYVYQGSVIGAVGNTGKSSGPHLHFELRSDQYGRVNPMNFLQ